MKRVESRDLRDIFMPRLTENESNLKKTAETNKDDTTLENWPNEKKNQNSYWPSRLDFEIMRYWTPDESALTADNSSEVSCDAISHNGNIYGKSNCAEVRMRSLLPVDEYDEGQDQGSYDDDNSECSLRDSFFHQFDFKQSIPSAHENIRNDLCCSDFSNFNVIYSGSHSKVYESTRLCDNKSIILKVIPNSEVTNRVTQKDFENEINILLRLNHPNIVRIEGHGFLDQTSLKQPAKHLQRPLLVLETMSGGTLSQLLRSKRSHNSRPFSTLRYLRILRELANALYYLHKKVHPDCAFIHRDLKPDNIGFTSDGTLKLLDFGLCICVRKNTSIRGFYNLTGCTGAYRYMAPENALNQCYNEKVDVYSFGLLAYEIITGYVPFSGYSRQRVYSDVFVGGVRPSLSCDDYGRDIRIKDDVTSLISACWHPDSTVRPTSEEVFTELTVAEGTEMEARRAGQWRLGTKGPGLLRRGLELMFTGSGASAHGVTGTVQFKPKSI